jgi:hypothetical protein
MVAAIVALSLASTAYGQSTTPPPAHHAKAKAKTNSNVAQPDKGTAPEQAVEPDASAPLTQTPNYDPPPPPPRPPDPEPPAPPPVAATSATPATSAADAPVQASPMVEKTEPPVQAEVAAPEPLRAMTPQEQQLEKDSIRLLTLVKELKQEIAKAGADTLSLSALRKAEEIQKLSKDLKERLKLQAASGTSQTLMGAQ